jgi:hypothetical protein
MRQENPYTANASLSSAVESEAAAPQTTRSTYPHVTISRCQSQARTKNFICNDCKWSKYPDKQHTFCTKPSSISNGEQYAPVNWCVEFELKEVPHE